MARATFRPLRDESPYFPLSICHAMRTVHSPVVGGLVNTHGQATSQLQASKYDPARFHLLAMFLAENMLTIKD